VEVVEWKVGLLKCPRHGLAKIFKSSACSLSNSQVMSKFTLEQPILCLDAVGLAPGSRYCIAVYDSYQ